MENKMEKMEKIVKDFHENKSWEKKTELTDSFIFYIACVHVHDYLIEIDTIRTDYAPSTFRMWITHKNGVGLFHYDSEYEAFADLYRVVTGDLEFQFTDKLITDKIYKYKTE